MVAIIIKEKPNFVKKKKGAVYGGILSVRNGPLARIKTEWNSIADMKVGNKIQVMPHRAAKQKSNADSW